MFQAKKILPIVVMLSVASITPAAYAASEDECAIWICAPGGFPGGCEKAHSAMLKRLKKGRAPLPPLRECLVGPGQGTNPDDYSYDMRWVLKIEEHQVCTKWQTVSGHNEDRYCVAYKTVPAHIRPGRSCFIYGSKDSDPVRIPGCVGAYRELKLFEKGKQMGQPYYF